MEHASITLLWLLPLLGVSIWLQRGASFLIPKKHLDRPFLRSLNRWAPMAVILTLIYVSLDTGLIVGWRGVAMEIAILTVFGLFYVATWVLLTVLLAAAAWGSPFGFTGLTDGIDLGDQDKIAKEILSINSRCACAISDSANCLATKGFISLRSM